MTESLADILGDPRDFIDTDSMSDELHEGRERDAALLAWAAKKPAMDLGLIPYEPRPPRLEPKIHSARVRAQMLCEQDSRFMLRYTAAQEYGISESVIRGWWTHHIIGGLTFYDGNQSVTVYRREDIERALRDWVPSKCSNDEHIDDDGLPARIERAATEYRMDASLLGNRVANGAPVAVARKGRSRPCGLSLPDAPRAARGDGEVGVAARGASFEQQEVA